MGAILPFSYFTHHGGLGGHPDPSLWTHARINGTCESNWKPFQPGWPHWKAGLATAACPVLYRLNYAVSKLPTKSDAELWMLVSQLAVAVSTIFNESIATKRLEADIRSNCCVIVYSIGVMIK